jgi:hypothetical protein
MHTRLAERTTPQPDYAVLGAPLGQGTVGDQDTGEFRDDRWNVGVPGFIACLHAN